MSEEIKTSKLYDITVDGRPFKVRAIVTGAQLKRLACCDNDRYMVYISNVADQWKEKDLTEKDLKLSDKCEFDCENNQLTWEGKKIEFKTKLKPAK